MGAMFPVHFKHPPVTVGLGKVIVVPSVSHPLSDSSPLKCAYDLNLAASWIVG